MYEVWNDKPMNYETRKVMFSSLDGGWRTPQELFDYLDSIYHFDTDVCADPFHPLKPIHQEPPFRNFYGNEGLTLPWTRYDGNCIAFMNPPYGREISKWLEKAWLQMTLYNIMTVALVPARLDSKWFWNYCFPQQDKGGIFAFKQRIRFINDDHDEVPAPFPSVVVVFKP